MRSRWDRHDALAPRRQHAIGVVPIALVLGSGRRVAASGIAPPTLLPPPAAVFARLIQQLGSPAYSSIMSRSRCSGCSPGFAIAVVIGVTLGVAATGSRAVEAVVRPLVRVLAPVPKIALYPAFILTLGFDHASKIALVVADAVFPILLATYQGTSAVEPKLVWSARAAGTSPRIGAVHGGADGGAAIGADRLPYRHSSSPASWCSWRR